MTPPTGSPCPNCGLLASGSFCRHCGTPRGGGVCPDCGTATSPAARFCKECGRPVGQDSGAGAAGGSRRTAWAVGGTLWFVVVGLIGWLVVQPDSVVVDTGPATTSVEDRLGLSNLDPRETADQFFNQIVDAAAIGDSAHVYAFLPLALEAYSEAAPLDLDGLFHVSTLFRIGGAPDQALESAQAILEVEPNHLLALGTAAQASLDLGKDAEATALYEQLLSVFQSELERELVEYVGHATFVERVRQDALRHLGRS